MDYYSDFFINRRQAQTLAFAIINDVENYIAEHQTEFEKFLESEKLESTNPSRMSSHLM